MRSQYIYVYQTICNINGKSYIGVHKTNNINDGYIGCGIFRKDDAKRNMIFHRAVRKYGYASFTRHILSFYDTYEEAQSEERFIVNERWVKNQSNYNTAIGGRGSTTSWMNDESKRKWTESIREGVNKWQNEIGKKIQNFGKDHHSYGVPSVTRRKVIKYNKYGGVIETFDSLIDAGLSVGRGSSNIAVCCNGKILKCGGYTFKYEIYSANEQAEYEINVLEATKNKKQPIIKLYKIRRRPIIIKSIPRKVIGTNKGYKLSEEHIQNLRNSNTRYWLDKHRSIETKNKLSLAHMGKKLSEDTKNKLHYAHKGQIPVNRKSIIQFSNDMIKINEFESLISAATHIGCLRTSISNNLTGATKKCAGYIFKYK